MDTQSSRMIAQAQQQNAKTNMYNAATNRTLGEINADIASRNAYTNEYNAKVNAKLTQQQVRSTQIENMFKPAEKIAGLINTSSQTSYNYARTMESAISGIMKVPTGVADTISKLARIF